jgi:hypothetical protein
MHSYVCYTFNSNTVTQSQWGKLCGFVTKQAKKHVNHPALANMGINTESGLLQNIHNKRRWTTGDGEVAVLEYQDEIVGISCVENSERVGKLTIGGIRCWLDDRHRNTNQVTTYLLDSNLSWSKNSGAVAMMLTFNDYNKIIYDGICKKAAGRAAGLGRVWSSWWNDCMPIDNQLNVRFTKQWCVIKPIEQHALQNVISELLNNE